MKKGTKVNFRVTKQGEVIAVFLGKQINNKYLCYSLYDGSHFDSDASFLKECKPAKGYNANELCAYLINRGYKDIIILSKMVY